MTQAVRLKDSMEGEIPSGLDMSRICYWWDRRQRWWLLYLPGGGIGNLSAHGVVEHDDGTITVSPSILVTSGGENRRRRHGFLKRGRWEPCSDDIPVEPEG